MAALDRPDPPEPPTDNPVRALLDVRRHAGTLDGQQALLPEIGDAGEAVVDQLMQERGYDLVEGVDGPGQHGIDRMYLDAEEGRLVVAEVKTSISGTPYRPGLADGARQGSASYVERSLRERGLHDLAEEVHEVGFSGVVSSEAWCVDLEGRTATRLELDEQGEVVDHETPTDVSRFSWWTEREM